MTQFQIIATIGPASRNLAVVEKLIQSGMTMARLSMAHDNYSAHLCTISLVREVCSQGSPTPKAYGSLRSPTPSVCCEERSNHQFGISVPILQDLQGPKLRIGNINVKLSRGQVVILTPVEHPDSTEEKQSSQNIGKEAPAFSAKRNPVQFIPLAGRDKRGVIPNSVHIPLIGEIHQHVKLGDLVLINNGIVQLEVKEVHGISTISPWRW